MDICKVDDCSRPTRYKSQGVCQKHYFRFMRYGTYSLTRKPAAPKRQNPKGYVLVRDPSHPLAHKGGYVYEHRRVVYGIYGENLPDCELCGKGTSWAPYQTHIDHIDEDTSNNDPSNLRVLCNPCNSQRSRPPAHTYSHTTSITWRGETKTVNGWAKDRRVPVSGTAIKYRLARGWSVNSALSTPARAGGKENQTKGVAHGTTTTH